MEYEQGFLQSFFYFFWDRETAKGNLAYSTWCRTISNVSISIKANNKNITNTFFFFSNWKLLLTIQKNSESNIFNMTVVVGVAQTLEVCLTLPFLLSYLNHYSTVFTYHVKVTVDPLANLWNRTEYTCINNFTA